MRTADRRPMQTIAAAPDDFAAAAALISALTADPERAPQTLVTRASTLLGTREIALFRLGPSGEATPVAGTANPDLAGVAARMRATTRPFVASGPEAAQQAGVAGARGVVAATIRMRGKPAGAIVAVNRTGVFDARHGAVAAFLADVAALTLERSVATGIEAVLHAGEQLSSVSDAKAVLDCVLDGGTRLLGATGGFVCLFDGETRSLRSALYRMLPREAVEATMANPGFPNLVHETSPRADVPAPNSPFAALAGACDSVVSIPLRAEGRPIGLVCLALREVPQPDPVTLRLLMALGQQAAATVRTAQLVSKVRTREAEMAAVVASFPNPLVVVDPDGTIVLINPSAEILFGLSNDFERGRQVQGRLPGQLDALFLTDTNETRDVHLGTPEPHHFTASISRVADEDGTELGKVLMLTDKTFEERAERMHADFVAVIGHELRTPLTLIKGFVKTLLRRGADMPPDSVLDALRTIDEQSQALEHLIEDLLFLSQSEQSTPKLYCEWGDLVGFVREWVGEQAQRWRGRGRELLFRSQTMEIPLYFDRAKLVQMLGHLVDNAMKYSEERVVVEVQRGPQWAEVSVVDYGIGIYSGDLESIFDRFTQVNSTSTREHGGTGIGLHICRRLVQAHGGRISVESQMGRGSQFTIRLPLDMTADGLVSGAATDDQAWREAAASGQPPAAGGGDFWWTES